MAYCTYDDFIQYGASVEIPEDEFLAISERASDIIDEITFYRLTNGGFDNLSDSDKAIVTRATCAQTEHLYYQGIETAFAGAMSGSYNIGQTSITKDNGTAKTANMRVSSIAYRMLFPTGLLYKGVGTF